MGYLKLLISPIAGAVIGYFTNWLAIKMLFKPHTEKRLFGMKLPFTPGLIPKERFRLSEKVGETIGTHLFTEEVIVNSLSTDEVKQSIQTILSKLYENVVNSEYTVDELLDKLFGENKEYLVEKAINGISEKAYEVITEEQVVGQITDYIINIITDFAKKPIAHYKLSRFSDSIEALYNKYAKDFADNEEFGNLLYSFFSDLENKINVQEKTIAEYLPENTDLFIKGIAENNMRGIFNIVDTIINIEEVNLFIRKILAEIINENVGKLMSLFINTDKITDNIMINLKEYLSADENIPAMLEKVNSLTDKLMGTEINKIVSKIPDDMRLAASVKVVEAVRYIIKDSNIIPKLIAEFNKFIEINNEKNIYSFIEGIEPEIGKKIKTFILSKSKSAIEKNGMSLFNKTFHSIVQKLLRLKVNSIANIISENMFKSFETKVISNIGFVTKKIAPYIISAVNIPKVVEDRVNGFDIGYAEEIIISVVNRELNAITVLGGVLGFIIGIIPSVLSVLGIY